MRTTLPRPLQTLAKSLRARIGAHARLIGVGVTSEVFDEARRASDEAQALATYLGRNLALHSTVRAAFLQQCGLQAEARRVSEA